WEKPPVKYGVITRKLLDYAREDVRHTGLLYRNCMAELQRHDGIDLKPHRLYSPATIGTRYLEAIGVRRPGEKDTDLDPRIPGWAMSAFFGGRAEARIVRTPVSIAYVDAASMYPTVNALLGTWRFQTAERINVLDVTTRVRDLLRDPTVYDRCFDRGFWSEQIG